MNSLIQRLGPLALAGMMFFAGPVGCERRDAGTGTTNTNGGGAAPSTGDILIGGFGSKTGDQAAFGTSELQGFELAVEEINSKGGLLGGRKVKLLFEDSASKPEDASTVVTKLVKQDRVVAVLGEVASSNSLAAAPICQQSGIPMVSPASTNDKVTKVGDYIFRVCFIDPFQGEVMAKFATNTIKAKKVAIMKDTKQDYSVGLTEAFKKAFEPMGGSVIDVVDYSSGDQDFSSQITRIKGLGADAIFVPGYYKEASLIAKKARESGLEIPILGGDGWDSDPLFEVGGASLRNCFYSTHFSTENPADAVQNFIKTFKAKFNVNPDANAALAYDAAKVLFDAISRAGTTDGAKVRDALAGTKDFAGVTGTMTINAERNAVKPAVVLECKVDGAKSARAFKETINP